MKKLLIPLLMLVIFLSSCNKSVEEVITYNIDFEVNGGIEVEDMILEEGILLERPIDPIKEYYTFINWMIDEELTEVYLFETEIIEDITLYAVWEYNYMLYPEDDLDLDSLPYSGYLNESNPVVTIVVRDIGRMTLELFPNVAPNTVNNFIMYIQNNEFSNNMFHRIIENFMIQGGQTFGEYCTINGDFSANGFTNNLSHYRGVISMARTSVMDSATSQFFIVHQSVSYLDGYYATFGGLTSGFNVLDYIAGVDTDYYDGPLETIVIESISVELNGYNATDPICAD